MSQFKLVNLATNHQSDLVTEPMFSSDRRLFATFVERPGLTPPPQGRVPLEVWSCAGGSEECKVIYKFPDAEFQAAFLAGWDLDAHSRSFAGVGTAVAPFSSVTAMECSEARQWKHSCPYRFRMVRFESPEI